MKLTQLLYFSTVCKCGNHITKASELLHVSQPCITNAIQELEEEFGVLLFHHIKKRLYLTDAGAQCLERVNHILEQTDFLSEQMKDIASDQHNVNLGITSLLSSFLLPSLIEQFQETRHGYKLNIHEILSQDILKNLQDETIDVAIIMSRNQVLPSGYCNILLGQTDLLFCTSTRNPLANSQSVRIQDLAGEPLVLISSALSKDNNILKKFERLNVRPNICYYLNQTETIQKIVQKNIASTFLFRESLGTIPGIAGIPIENEPKAEYMLVFNKNRYHHKNTLDFIDFAENLLHLGQQAPD